MKKSILFILVATLIISMIAGCGTQPAEPANPSQPSESKGSKSGEGKTIGISLTSKALARTNLDSIYLSEYLKELGYEVIIQFSEGDVNVQNSQIETMVGLGIDGLIVSPSDGTGLTNAMEICHENDVKVCVYDALVMNSPYVEYYATDDLFAVGKCQGQYC